MSISEIQEILDHQADPCVSMIIPTHRTSPERRYDSLVTKKFVVEVKNLLSLLYFDERKTVLKDLFEKIDNSIDALDFDHLEEGIGIFISPKISKIVSFPFPVTQKVKIDTNFYARDLLYYLQNRIEYTVISLSQKNVQLFVGKGNHLTEVINNDFPMTFVEEYDYSKPNSMATFGSHISKSYEKDKGEMQEIRVKGFFKNVDYLLKNNPKINSSLVLAGTKKEILDFLQVTTQLDNIIGKLVGNYNFNSTHLLADKVWEVVQFNLKIKEERTINLLQEFKGKRMLAVGIFDAWRATNEGKVLELIVEKDYLIAAYLSKDENVLKLSYAGSDENFVRVNDMVEKIIRTVLEKKGKILFVENGALSEFDNIALKLRYPDVG